MFGFDQPQLDQTYNVTVSTVDSHRFDISFYDADSRTTREVATVDAADDGFGYLRSLSEVPHFSQSDYEMVLEYAEEELADHFNADSTEYRLAEQAAGEMDDLSDMPDADDGNPILPP